MQTLACKKGTNWGADILHTPMYLHRSGTGTFQVDIPLQSICLWHQSKPPLHAGTRFQQGKGFCVCQK